MNWATIVPLLIGSGLTLATTFTVEFFKFRQASRAARRERREQRLKQLQDRIVEMQTSLVEMMKIAAQILQPPATEEDERALRTQFLSALHKCFVYNSRLPEEEWRKAIDKLLDVTADACEENVDQHKAETLWEEARNRYYEEVQRIAAPFHERSERRQAKAG